jgi:hypothetical protein
MTRTFLIAALYLFGHANAVWAALGQSADSVLDDRASMNATMTTRSDPLFQVYDLQGTGGMTVREYVSPAGRVFAVAWDGPSVPDLSRLLGAYAEHYREMQKQRSSLSMRTATEDATLVVQSGGHLRAFAGRAYLPAELPAGVTPDVIK